MIDLIKVYVEDKLEFEKNIHDNSFGRLTSNYLLETDDKIYPIKDNLENLKINITDKYAYIENSIHKFYNIATKGENQNYDDFNFCDFKLACKMLENKLRIDFDNTYLTRFEFGLNIDLGSNPTDFLDENILFYNYKTPCYNPKYKPREKIKKFSLNDYEIKIYNKSEHFRLKENLKNILRIEIKYKTKKIIQRLGVFNLKDLQNKDVILNIYADFFNKIKDVIIVDDYKGSLYMNSNEREDFIKYTNQNYWIDINKNLSKNMKNYHKTKLLKMIEKFKLDKMRNTLLMQIQDKFDELMRCDCMSEQLKLIA